MLSILLFLCSFFFPDGVQAHALPGEGKIKIAVEQTHEGLLTSFVNTHHFELEQNLVRVVPASHCGQVQKHLGNGHWSTLSFTVVDAQLLIPLTLLDAVAKNNYLSHIYPSHNFW